MGILAGIVWTALAVGIAAAVALSALRISDQRHAETVWKSLWVEAKQDAAEFDPAMVDGLPEPARRFFLYTIGEGVRLRTVAEIEMEGEIGLGDRFDPRYLAMRGHQVIAPPHGFVWKLEAGSGMMSMAGSDGFAGSRSWVRFWLLKFLPVVRKGGNPDHVRSAFGRLIAESVFFAPAALLPGKGVEWEAVSPDTARATVIYRDMVQSVAVSVDEEGRPHTVVIPRWSNANFEKSYRVQPFGGRLSEFRSFEGYMLPTRIEGGNFIGTPDYFPFYRAHVLSIRFTEES
jgi:hypothetical protein